MPLTYLCYKGIIRSMTNLDLHINEIVLQKSRNQLVKIVACTTFSEDEIFIECIVSLKNNHMPWVHIPKSDAEKLTLLDTCLLFGVKHV